MPIAPEHRWLYPIDWRELSNLIRFGRAKGRCEHCRRPHGRDVLHLGDGVWWDEDASRWRDGQGGALRCLAALCQRCHMRHDAGEHRRRRWLNAFRVRAIGDLFA